MSAGGAFGGSRGVKPMPPEKGVFPLDHFHECRPMMQEYMQCLKDNKMLADRCKYFSKQYLECRMERNLMHKQDLKELGFNANGEEAYVPKNEDGQESEGLLDFMKQPRKEGHIAGLRKKRPEKPQEEDMIN